MSLILNVAVAIGLSVYIAGCLCASRITDKMVLILLIVSFILPDDTLRQFMLKSLDIFGIEVFYC